jgi:chromosome segregation ATPase
MHANDIVMQNAAQFLACDQERGALSKTLDTLKEENTRLGDSVTNLSQLLESHGAKSKAEIDHAKEQLRVSQDEAMEWKVRAEKAEMHVKEAKQAHVGVQGQADVLQLEITRLHTDLKALQEERDKLATELKAAQSEGHVRRDLEAKLAAATHTASSEMVGLQVRPVRIAR